MSPFGDPRQFVHNCVGLVDAPARAPGRGEAARQAALKDDWEAVFDDYERVLHNLFEQLGMRIQRAV